MSKLSIRERFWSKVNAKDLFECWEYKGHISRLGYGQFEFQSKSVGAHRVAWILTYGFITEGKDILHKCDHRSCCNLSHLFEGTHQDNMADMVKKGRSARGELQRSAKLTELQVIEILRNVKDIKDKKYYSDKFNISISSIQDITSFRTWKYIERM